jgi:hypothetical protein
MTSYEEHRRHAAFDHPSSRALRAVPEPDPIEELRAAHRAQRQELGAKQRDEVLALDAKHAVQAASRGDAPHSPKLAEDAAKERTALLRSHERAFADMEARHARELGQAVARHGAR